jgi:pilus assembly protein CpaF
MIKLTMTEKGGDPKALSFDKDEVTIGRVSGNDIVLPKGNVSKRHTRLALKDGHVEISDLKSTNGTYVNGKKIVEPVVLGATDRVYVGDFLLTIDGLGGELGAHARRPPPPPPPPRAASSAAKLPSRDAPPETTSTGGDGSLDDEDELGLAAKPPRAGRVPPPPPPPPPRRPPTPLATRPVDDDDALGGDLPAPSPAEMAAADDSTNNLGLFAQRKSSDHASFDGDGDRGPPTGNRPGPMMPPEPAPLPAVPGQPFAAPATDLSGPTSAPDDGLEGLLADPAVVQVIVGPEATYVDRGAGPARHAEGLGDPNVVADTLWRLANTAVPPPSPDNPVVDVRLPDGSRLAAVFPPVSALGVVGSIRRPPQTERALVDLIPPGAKDVQTLLETAVVGQRNLLLTGDAAALPVLATALAALVPADRRVVCLAGVLLRGRAGWIELGPTNDLPGLVRVAGSLRAEHLFVGDVVGVEALDLLLAATRGQEGLVLAVPSRTVFEGLARVEALASASLGGGGGVTAAAALVSSSIDLVVHAVANTDGGTRIVDIAEPRLDATAGGGHVGLEPVVTWRGDGGRRGSGAGKLHIGGVSTRLGAALSAVGLSLPSSLTRR